MVYILNDLSISNPDLFLRPLADVLSTYPYLGTLNVHGSTQSFKVAALCGNGCVELLNAWDDILEQLLGKHDFGDTELFGKHTPPSLPHYLPSLTCLTPRLRLRAWMCTLAQGKKKRHTQLRCAVTS